MGWFLTITLFVIFVVVNVWGQIKKGLITDSGKAQRHAYVMITFNIVVVFIAITISIVH